VLSGFADAVLKIEEMPERIVRYAAHPYAQAQSPLADPALCDHKAL
jgi:hypothetical protein